MYSQKYMIEITVKEFRVKYSWMHGCLKLSIFIKRGPNLTAGTNSNKNMQSGSSLEWAKIHAN